MAASEQHADIGILLRNEVPIILMASLQPIELLPAPDDLFPMDEVDPGAALPTMIAGSGADVVLIQHIPFLWRVKIILQLIDEGSHKDIVAIFFLVILQSLGESGEEKRGELSLILKLF